MAPRTVARLRGGRGPIVIGALLLALLLVLALATVGLPGSGGEDDAARVTEEERQVRVDDGVALDSSVFTPPADTPGADGEGRRDAVVLAHGFGGSKDDMETMARDLAADGFVALTYTARGFGDSGGRIHLNHPDREIADVSVLIDRLAARDDVRRDGRDDPSVGVAGYSYGGAAALMAAGYDDRVDAVASAITWHDLGQALFPQSAVRDRPRTSPAAVSPIADEGVFKQRWAALFFGSGLAAGGPGDDPGSGAPDGQAPGEGDGAAGGMPCGAFAPAICELYDEAATTGRPGEGTLARLRRSSPAPVLDRIDAPTLLVQGQQDSLFGLDHADANARGLAAAGTPVGVHWVDGGHDATPGASGEDGTAAEQMTGATSDWFDHHLRDGPDPGPGFELDLPPSQMTGETETERLGAPSYPVDGVPDGTEVYLVGDGQRLLAPPGGQPSALTTLPGGGGLLAATDLDGSGYEMARLPGQSATFGTLSFSEPHRVVGAPRVRLQVTSSTTDATLFASLWVVSGDDRARLPRRLVAPVRLDGLTPGQPEEVEVALPGAVYEVDRGDRLRLVVSTTDQAFAVPDDARGYQVSLADGGALWLPGVDAEPVGGETLVPVPLLVAAAAVVLLAGVAGVVLSRRRRGSVAPEHRDVPLVVEGLTQSYPDGLRAVDAASWRAERGQVVGLLGPNGAGKTTTMRMLVGLIHPDAGRTLVLGEEVRPGAPVLGQVGTLIEGPGFLPHLTGRDNLAAYWAATGRPTAEAHVEEALEIAGLGTSVDRPVRTYSHGMRQRLGIAQAMLGLPELLLLDEPTNGLDPPQIRALRGVLQRYAAAGRTVVVSSHLLAEVEQTCSHVVVMHRGQVLLTGSVADLLDATGGHDRRHLEDLFMSLVGENGVVR